MSAWNPTVSGSPTRSRRSTILRQECMPAQQISPSAARRSPCSRAILPASLNVSAILAWLPEGSPAQSPGPVAESIRTTPFGRTPSSRSVRAMWQPLWTCLRNCLRPSPSSIAEPPPVGGQTGATTVPMVRPRERTLSARILRSSRRGVDVDVRCEQEEVHAVELHAVDLGRGGQVEHRVEGDRRLGPFALADHSGPGRVVQLREGVGMAAAHGWRPFGNRRSRWFRGRG